MTEHIAYLFCYLLLQIHRSDFLFASIFFSIAKSPKVFKILKFFSHLPFFAIHFHSSFNLPSRLHAYILLSFRNCFFSDCNFFSLYSLCVSIFLQWPKPFLEIVILKKNSSFCLHVRNQDSGNKMGFFLSTHF